MRLHLAVITALPLLLCLATPGFAAGNLRRDLDQLQRLREAMDVDADHLQYNEAEKKLVAQGHVHIVLQNRSLFADEVSVDLDDQVFVATGHVIFMEGLNRLEGERIEYNYRTNLGVVTQGSGFLAPGLSFSGREIRREGERQFHILDGEFTTCRVCEPAPAPPDWEFRAKDATIHQDEFVIARDTSFWVKGIPALYTPIIAFPVGPRRTGFLIPRVGYGNSDGFKFTLPFFWAINPSQDFTLTTTYRAKRGPDVTGDYRYVLSADSRGELSARYIHDNEATPRDRSEFKWLHDQVIDPIRTFKADVAIQSVRSINREFVDSSVAERTQRTLDSRIFLTQATDRYLLLGLLDYTQDLSPEAIATHSSRLPDLRFQWLPDRILESPVLGEGETSAVYLEQSKAKGAGRFDFHPGLHLPVPLTDWLMSTTSTAFRATAYSESQQGGASSNRVLVDVGERVLSRFGRRFEGPGFGLLGLTHIVEPSLGYRYVPWTDQQGLPQFDRTDFISGQNRVTYQLGNRLVARWQDGDGAVRAHEVFRLNIAQSWNVQPGTRNFSDVYLTGLTPERVDQAVKDVVSLGNGFSQARERSLSNLVLDTSLSPLPPVAVRTTVALNTDQRRTDAINTELELRLPAQATVGIGSSYVRDQVANGIVGRFEVNVTKDILVSYLTRYDLHTSTSLENTIGLRYSTCCWDVSLNFTNRARGVNQMTENSFHITVDLKAPGLTASR
jgi:lipopolysaccharide assembly outer membrane protein LptD (OstA)